MHARTAEKYEMDDGRQRGNWTREQSRRRRSKGLSEGKTDKRKGRRRRKMKEER